MRSALDGRTLGPGGNQAKGNPYKFAAFRHRMLPRSSSERAGAHRATCSAVSGQVEVASGNWVYSHHPGSKAEQWAYQQVWPGGSLLSAFAMMAYLDLTAKAALLVCPLWEGLHL